MFSYLNIRNTAKVFTTVASLAASAILVRKVFSSLNYLHHLCNTQTKVIENDQEYGSLNEEFRAVDIYLGTIVPSSFDRLRVVRKRDMKELLCTLDTNQEIVDVFENIQVKWKLVFRHVEASEYRREYYIRSYELTFDKKHEEKVLNSYLPYISKRSKAIIEECKVIRLYGVNHACGVSEHPFDFDHPITFENLAMDSELKAMVVDDLKMFVNGEECYRSRGKQWKRGYLLYGPPGTGKSSLIAAMANHLKYDIYDFHLSELFERNPEFLGSLIRNSCRESVLVVEDIDNTVLPQNQKSEDQAGNNDKKLEALMELLNEAWSCCGDGQILVFTTSNKEIMLDPALLKPGLIDLQIRMSYCTISAFNQLAFNHFGSLHHKLFGEIEGLLQKVKVTLAEVAVELRRSHDAEVSLQGIVTFLRYKNAEQDQSNTSQQEYLSP